jgi:hypothetical protein
MTNGATAASAGVQHFTDTMSRGQLLCFITQQRPSTRGGRCFHSTNPVHKAFLAYTKAERIASTDGWLGSRDTRIFSTEVLMAFVKQYTDRCGTFNLVKAAKGPIGQDATTSTASLSAAAPSKSGDPTSAKTALLAADATDADTMQLEAASATTSDAKGSTCLETSALIPGCNCVECSSQIVMADFMASTATRDLMIASPLGAFGTQTHDPAWARNRRIALAREKQPQTSLSPTILHFEPHGSEYLECALHGYTNIECRRAENIDAFIYRFINNLRMYHLHCDIVGHARPQCSDVFKHFKTAVRRYDGNQFNEEFQAYCNLGTALELAALFSDMCDRSGDRSAAYGKARCYGFVPRNPEQCTCASCVTACCQQTY